jgi:hypothetical protein
VTAGFAAAVSQVSKVALIAEAAQVSQVVQAAQLAEIVQSVPLISPVASSQPTDLQQFWISAFEQWSQMMPVASGGKLVPAE